MKSKGCFEAPAPALTAFDGFERRRRVSKRWIAGMCAAALGGLGVGAGALRTATPAAEVHFAPDENLERIDVGLIDAARSSLDVAAYVLTDRAVIAAIERAARRGVAVRIWRDPEMAGKVGLGDVAALIAPDEPGVAMRLKPPGALMHLKGYCVDGETLRTGSANFSRSGLHDQDNDLVVLRSPAACARFEAKFARAWGDR